ncbi:MAG: DsbA family protein [Bacteroidota bacterium]
MNNCDPDGFCEPAPLEDNSSTNSLASDLTVIYVGDPMCSWCWGITEHLKSFRKSLKQQGIKFEILMGGLRPGGGDPWNDKMKNFLKHHWEEVNKRSGQPFGYGLFEKESFNYDTEPACRAVVTSRNFLEADQVNDFYEEVQRKFYVDSQDPNETEFYRSICEMFEIDFEEFKSLFGSNQAKEATRNEFVLNREWGVRGYPTVLLSHKTDLHMLARGYADEEELTNRLSAIEQRLVSA